MAGSVKPLGKIVYVCDDVLRDPASGKTHVVGAFDTVRVPLGADYPFVLDHLCVFAQFAGGRGAIAFRVTVVDASTGDEVFGSSMHSVTMPSGHGVVTLLIRLEDCSFPDPGTYLIQLFADGDFVDDRRLTLI
jgi:hypothetical protein